MGLTFTWSWVSSYVHTSMISRVGYCLLQRYSRWVAKVPSTTAACLVCCMTSCSGSASAVQMLHSCSLFNRVDLIKPVSNVRPSVSTFCLCVRTGTYARPSTKSFFDFNKIWHVGRGWWVMHNGVQYDPILSQSHEPLKVGNLAILKSYLLCHLQWELATDHWFLN